MKRTRRPALTASRDNRTEYSQQNNRHHRENYLPLAQAITTKKDTKEEPIQQEENKPHSGKTHSHKINHRKKLIAKGEQKKPVPRRIQEPFPTPDEDY